MDETRVRTRLSLHAVAELLLAGPQYVESGTIHLRATPGGFGDVSAPNARVEGIELVAGENRMPLVGTIATVGEQLDLQPRTLDDVYSGGPGLGAEHELQVDPTCAVEIADAFAVGEAALRAFAPAEEPVLWPEHFDIAITVAEVNYGVSPGDDHLPEPYAYVGPWTPRAGEFWNAPFGAARPVRELGGVEEVSAFFAQGAELAAVGPT